MAQLSLFDIGAVSSRQFEPVQTALEGASLYTHGGHSIEGLENVKANKARAFRTQKAYKDAQASPQEDPRIRRSYAAMADEVNRQHEFMTASREDGGMGLNHEVVGHDPYQSPQEMAQDVAGGRIRTMATAATGGHGFFPNEVNDKFRAVHDVFGHAAVGRGFSRNGEEAAFLSHRQMFSKRAIPALASETRGQNSFLNYGATQDHPVSEFPSQEKLVGLPGFASRT